MCHSARPIRKVTAAGVIKMKDNIYLRDTANSVATMAGRRPQRVLCPFGIGFTTNRRFPLTPRISLIALYLKYHIGRYDRYKGKDVYFRYNLFSVLCAQLTMPILFSRQANSKS